MKQPKILGLAVAPLALSGCQAGPAAGGAGLAADILGVLAALAFVVALAFLSLHVLRRLNVGVGGPAEGEGPRFVRALPLGPRERLVVVSYRGERLLIGVTAGGVSLIDRRAEAAEPDRAREIPS